MAQIVKNLSAMLEIQVQSLCGEDSLEKGTATHSNTFAWRISWTQASYSPWGCKESDMSVQLTLSLSIFNTQKNVEHFHFKSAQLSRGLKSFQIKTIFVNYCSV